MPIRVDSKTEFIRFKAKIFTIPKNNTLKTTRKKKVFDIYIVR